jgi:hypothetical protein
MNDSEQTSVCTNFAQYRWAMQQSNQYFWTYDCALKAIQVAEEQLVIALYHTEMLTEIVEHTKEDFLPFEVNAINDACLYIQNFIDLVEVSKSDLLTQLATTRLHNILKNHE